MDNKTKAMISLLEKMSGKKVELQEKGLKANGAAKAPKFKGKRPAPDTKIGKMPNTRATEANGDEYDYNPNTGDLKYRGNTALAAPEVDSSDDDALDIADTFQGKVYDLIESLHLEMISFSRLNKRVITPKEWKVIKKSLESAVKQADTMYTQYANSKRWKKK